MESPGWARGLLDAGVRYLAGEGWHDASARCERVVGGGESSSDVGGGGDDVVVVVNCQKG